jgi:hypothetical protein
VGRAAGATAGARAGGKLGHFGQRAEWDTAARLGEKLIFQFSIFNKFQITVFKSHFEQENDFF